MIDRIIICPDGRKTISIDDMEKIFDQAGANYETIFRRFEFNHVIKFTEGIGIDFGCGLNKIHSYAIGVDFQLGKIDAGYAFGANIKVAREKDTLKLPWFNTESLDYAFSSHCLEHFANPASAIAELLRVIKPGGYLVTILPHMKYYPKKGQGNYNVDHEWDCYPDTFVKLVKNICLVEVVQFDTLRHNLENVELTERDKKIARHYGHQSLNFSFEAVLRKLQ